MQTPENLTIICRNNEEKTENIEWCDHPKFKGVRMKNIIKGESTEGLMSCHIVQVMPGCSLETHIHENSFEMHEVIEGSGICVLDEKEICYHPGIVAIIPKGSPHMVMAGENGLVMMARFAPALM